MSKRKGLSADDKRRVILKIYHEKKEPFNLKEMELLASKAGVVQQTVKDMNQSLVDDFMVYSDKIGSANFFWSFPSKALQDKKNLKEQLEAQLVRSRESTIELERRLEEERLSRSAEGRADKVARYTALKNQERELDATLEAGKANDPVELDRVTKQATDNMDHANRWTDNIWTVKSFLVKKKGMSGKDADKYLRIESDFDYVSVEDFKKANKGGGKGGASKGVKK